MNLSQDELRRKRLYRPLPTRYTTHRERLVLKCAAFFFATILLVVLISSLAS